MRLKDGEISTGNITKHDIPIKPKFRRINVIFTRELRTCSGERKASVASVKKAYSRITVNQGRVVNYWRKRQVKPKKVRLFPRKTWNVFIVCVSNLWKTRVVEITTISTIRSFRELPERRSHRRIKSAFLSKRQLKENRWWRIGKYSPTRVSPKNLTRTFSTVTNAIDKKLSKFCKHADTKNVLIENTVVRTRILSRSLGKTIELNYTKI